MLNDMFENLGAMETVDDPQLLKDWPWNFEMTEV